MIIRPGTWAGGRIRPGWSEMSAENQRVQEAEDLLVGLAVPGTAAHTALLQLQSALDAGAVPTSVLHAGFIAVTAQARMSLRAGTCALAQVRPSGEPPHWTTVTAHDWRRYLRWLVAILDRAAGAVDDEWDRASAACARAREVWGAVAGSLGAAVPASVEDNLDTVVIGGRT